MIKNLALAALFSLLFLKSFSQTDTTSRNTSHYLGVQANQLIRQIFNFSGSNAAVNNPYLLIYSLNSARSGHGLNVGLGYFINEITDGDASNKRKTDISNLSLRFGWERKKSIGKRWMASYGIDVVILNNKNETVNTIEFEPNKSVHTTVSSLTGKGFGPRLTVNYAFSSSLMLGTELNYYYTKGENKVEITSEQTAMEWDPNTGTMRPRTTTEKEEIKDETKRFELTPPVAIFLILKL
jgi:hypothetical protein